MLKVFQKNNEQINFSLEHADICKNMYILLTWKYTAN